MLIHLLFVLLILGLIFYVVWWGISQIPLPAPFAVAVKVILALIVVLVLLEYLLPLAGDTGVHCGRLIC